LSQTTLSEEPREGTLKVTQIGEISLIGNGVSREVVKLFQIGDGDVGLVEI
jgi:hypothetical protein